MVQRARHQPFPIYTNQATNDQNDKLKSNRTEQGISTTCPPLLEPFQCNADGTVTMRILTVSSVLVCFATKLLGLNKATGPGTRDGGVNLVNIRNNPGWPPFYSTSMPQNICGDSIGYNKSSNKAPKASDCAGLRDRRRAGRQSGLVEHHRQRRPLGWLHSGRRQENLCFCCATHGLHQGLPVRICKRSAVLT